MAHCIFCKNRRAILSAQSSFIAGAAMWFRAVLDAWPGVVGMTDIASILACYRSGQISEAEMVDICREWLEVEAALHATTKDRRKCL
jgi:hypothetical protein